MLGILMSIISGISMSLQGVFNTRLGEKIGTWETNVFVQGTGFVITLIILFLAGKGNFKNIKSVNKLYLLGGVLGVIIIFTVMEGIEKLGPTCSIATILVAQLAAAGLIDAFGLFGSEKLHFGITKYIGIGLMIFGIILFKWKG
ncbi:DMT family transporter [Haloimpatiens lingqiaonensis]|uniref:DMT family transporter n=1 Tax=Haloimpatiens lingqiaonensis TaxID=1380675 RepID=UPI0010FEBA62|nr:DMT family transporter [Haloimpatiens lingqiaonensis]